MHVFYLGEDLSSLLCLHVIMQLMILEKFPGRFYLSCAAVTCFVWNNFPTPRFERGLFLCCWNAAEPHDHLALPCKSWILCCYMDNTLYIFTVFLQFNISRHEPLVSIWIGNCAFHVVILAASAVPVTIQIYWNIRSTNWTVVIDSTCHVHH